MKKFWANARLSATGTAQPGSRAGFVWFTALLLSLSTGCVSRTLRFEYNSKEGGSHRVTVRTTSFFSRTALESLKEEVQTSEFVSGSTTQGLWTRPDKESLEAIVKGAVKGALGIP